MTPARVAITTVRGHRIVGTTGDMQSANGLYVTTDDDNWIGNGHLVFVPWTAIEFIKYGE